MFGPKVKLDKALYDRARSASQIAGYASVDEFVAHVLEKELSHLEGADSEDEIRKRLQGLGYLS